MADQRKDDWTKAPPVEAPKQAFRGPRAMLTGFLGPPGSGKTRSMLRMMRGAQQVFPGPIVVIDTEAGRSLDFAPKPGEAPNPDHPTEPTYDFFRIELDPPFRSDRFLAAVKAALQLKPAAIGIDNLSDEHIGEGGYLEYHDKEVERMGGNEFAAWNRPAALRRRMISGLIHIACPPLLYFTFISEEKSEQKKVKEDGREKTKIVPKGWTPVAPLLILKALNLTCLLPWDSKGVPIWKSRDLAHEDFIRKWPDHLLALMTPGQLTEAHGAALARWAKGGPAAPLSVGSDLKPPATLPNGQAVEVKALLEEVRLALLKASPDNGEAGKAHRADLLARHFCGATGWRAVQGLSVENLQAGLESLNRETDGLAAMREPGEDPREDL